MGIREEESTVKGGRLWGKWRGKCIKKSEGNVCSVKGGRLWGKWRGKCIKKSEGNVC